MYAAAFLLDFSVAAALTAVPFLLAGRLGGGARLLGAVGALQMGLYSGGCLVSSLLIPRAGNTLAFALMAVGIFALLLFLTPFLDNTTACAAAACLPFLGLSLAWPAMQSWLGREPDAGERARHVGGFNTATALGFMASPLAAGPLYDFHFHAPFLLLFGCCITVIALLASLPSGTPEASGPACNTGSIDKNASYSLTPGLLYASWLATFTANGLVSALRSLYPMQISALSESGNILLAFGLPCPFLDRFGPATLFSWMAFLLSFSTVACFILLGRTSGWKHRFSWTAASQMLAAFCVLLLGHTHSIAVMFLCFAVAGANYGLCFFASLYYSLACAPSAHRRAAVNEGALGAGGFAGAMGLGYAASATNLTTAFIWAPVAVLAAVALQYGLLRKYRAIPVVEQKIDT